MNSATTLAHSINSAVNRVQALVILHCHQALGMPRLSIALQEAAKDNLIELHVKIDGRGAGIFLL
jgi:hypothetical protein